jgi:5'-nucleotidase
MNKKHVFLGSLAATALMLGIAHADTATVKIIAFNDFHGNLQSPGTFSGSPSGGVDVLATYVNNLKAQNPNNVVVSAGDLIGASPLISAFFHDEGSIETMNRLGLEFNAVGNHEFDEGRAELLRMQNGGCHPTDSNSCQGAAVGTPVPFEGAKFKFLAANVFDTATGKTLFVPYGIKSFGNLRVGFIGLTLKDTPSIVTPSGVAGLTFQDEADTVNALIPKLRARGVEAIVVLIHQGGFQASTAPNFINDCSGALQDPITSPIKGVVSRLDDAVDLVISGHTHTGYNCLLPNKVGRNIPVTQASSFGRVLSDINLSIDTATGNVTAVAVNNIIVNRSAAGITPDATIAGIVNGYNNLVSPLANAVVGSITGPATNSANAAGEMDAGDLIADAQWQATQPAQFGGAQLAFMNAGGVRNPGFTATTYPHDVTYGETFTVQPFGNTLVTVTMTAQQIKDVLEQQFTGCNGQPAQRVLQASNGFSFSWSASAAACSKIVDVALNGVPLVTSGTVLNPSSTYRVTINNFLSTGGDNFTVFKSATNALGGPQDIDALIAYLANFKVPNAPYNPSDATLNKPRVTRLP